MHVHEPSRLRALPTSARRHRREHSRSLFVVFVKDVGRTTRSDLTLTAPLKSMYRAMEKAAFRDDDKQWSADCVCDIVRGLCAR